MDTEDISAILKKLGKTVENKIADAMGTRDDGEEEKTRTAYRMPPMRGEYMDYMEPDWEELDRKADLIVAQYAVVSAAWNILPPPLDVMGVTATFAKMSTELAGVYQVIVSNKRARQIGWAIATTTASVLGITFAGSRLVRFIPGGGWLAALLLQAPVVGAVAWAAGDALKGYFKQARLGVEPDLNSLRDSFARTLRIRLKKVKADLAGSDAPTTEAASASTSSVAPSASTASSAAPPAQAPPAKMSVSDIVGEIASLHELLRAGAITQAEFDAAKAELLKKI
ncbi:MAG: hypothetical protein OHK0029_13510 [Armatimonadaceae bacterium]